MHGKGMAILLSKGPSAYGPDESDGEDMGNDEESAADSVEFTEMFDAWTESMGVKPKDPEAARRRLCALFGIYCAHQGY